MSGEKYAERAVELLAAAIESGLAAKLRATETLLSLTSGALVDPVAYERGTNPFDDRSPLLQVWAEDGQAVDYNNDLDYYRCGVVLSHAGDADVRAGQLKARRYMTALIDCIRANPTLSTTGAYAIDTDRGFFQTKAGSDEPTRHHTIVGVDVRIHQP